MIKVCSLDHLPDEIWHQYSIDIAPWLDND